LAIARSARQARRAAATLDAREHDGIGILEAGLVVDGKSFVKHGAETPH